MWKARSIFHSCLELSFFFSPLFLFCTHLIPSFFLYHCIISFAISFMNLLVNVTLLFYVYVRVYRSKYKSFECITIALISFNGEYDLHTLSFFSFIIVMSPPVSRSDTAFEKWELQYILTCPAHKIWMLRKLIQVLIQLRSFRKTEMYLSI